MVAKCIPLVARIYEEVNKFKKCYLKYDVLEVHAIFSLIRGFRMQYCETTKLPIKN